MTVSLFNIVVGANTNQTWEAVVRPAGTPWLRLSQYKGSIGATGSMETLIAYMNASEAPGWLESQPEPADICLRLTTAGAKETCLDVTMRVTAGRAKVGFATPWQFVVDGTDNTSVARHVTQSVSTEHTLSYCCFF